MNSFLIAMLFFVMGCIVGGFVSLLLIGMLLDKEVGGRDET